MQSTLHETAQIRARVAAEPRIVASLVADREKAVLHLAQLGGEWPHVSASEGAYALGIPVSRGVGAVGEMSGSVSWHVLGQLDLEAVRIERVLLGGLSVLAMKHVREADVQIGDAVVVFGTTPWSLLLLQWVKLQGASPLVFAGSGSQRFVECVSSIGVEAHLTDPKPSDIARAVKLTPHTSGFAVALDAIATERSVTQGLPAVRDGGRYVLAGLDPAPSIVLNAYPDLHRRDLEIVSPMHSSTELDAARMLRFSLDLADKGRLDLECLVDPAFGWRVAVTGGVR